MTIHLREVTRDTVSVVCKLDAGDDHKQVAPNAVSIAQAHFQGEAWFRAVYDDERLVGFVMLYDPTLVEQPDEPDFFLWRLMIDQSHQGKGHGRAAVEALVDHVRTRPGAQRLLVSHVKGVDRLGRFYQSIGFRYTGAEDGGELVMERILG
ncbi:MAG TPA: GNAT family N-acetyltransferase [Burkholderiaceae bacterium]|nr:GNAT family N-acetyltransferase [Burkholderiaceae bacterium]